MTIIENLPKTLRDTGKFCLWRYEADRDGRSTKRPYNPKTGNTWAKVNDPDTFTDIHTAEAVYNDNEGYFAGIGAGIFGSLAGIDIDHCIDRDTGTISGLAADIMDLMNGAYMEKSPSGTGLRILFTLPEGYKYNTEQYFIHAHNGVEIYTAGNTNRFLTLTGNTLTPGQDLVEMDPATLDRVLIKYMQRPKDTPKDPAPVAPLDMSDAELLDKARAGSDLFRRLYDAGDISGFNSQSEADLALCGMLAFWTQRDKARIDAMFRGSALMRKKWDRDKYRTDTIDTAVSNCGNVYDPDNYRSGTEWTQEDRDALEAMRNSHRTEDEPDEYGDMEFLWDDEDAEATGDDSEALTAVLHLSGEEIPDVQPEAVENDSGRSETRPADPKPNNTADYIRNRFEHDRTEFSSANIKTGFGNLDELLGGLYSGLYVLAAASSLGKTTFCIQLADMLAGAGHDVIYFSLEQSKLDLVCKSLARIMGGQALKDGENPDKYPSETDIKKGERQWLTERAADTYINTVGDRLSVVEGNFNYGLKNIKEYTTAYMDANGVRPVIIVDYLQIISPNYEGERRPLREAIDMIVSELKRFSRDNNLTVILISSVNRASYTDAIDFDSLKESGGIEYTADCVIGLQYAVISEDRKTFEDPKKTKAEKQRTLDKARYRTPAIIEAKILKNRFGESRKSCRFDYYMGNALFVPTDEYNRTADNEEPYSNLEIG